MDGSEGSAEVGEVLALFDRYEAALRANDVDVLNAMFWDDPAVLRFGVGDMQHGYDELAAWRAAAPPVSAARTITGRHALVLAPGVVAVDVTFVDGDDRHIGRQSQTWVRGDAGWRIVRAHVSVIHA